MIITSQPAGWARRSGGGIDEERNRFQFLTIASPLSSLMKLQRTDSGTRRIPAPHGFLATNVDREGAVHPEQLYRCATDRCLPDNHEVVGDAEVFTPPVGSRIEHDGRSAGLWVGRRCSCSLRRDQDTLASARLPKMVAPPSRLGRTWSTWNVASWPVCEIPQYSQRLLARSRTRRCRGKGTRSTFMARCSGHLRARHGVEAT
jgi:hypothetical protein